MKNNIEFYVRDLKNKGISITDITKKAGIGRTSFYEIMKGDQIPKISTANKICRALNADIKDIFPQLKGGLK